MTRADHQLEPLGITPHRQRRRLAGDRAWDLVGRQPELSELVGALDQLDRGESAIRLVEVTGDAGIGKTALLSEFAKSARAAGAVVLTGWGTRGPHNTPFGAFTEAFEGYEGALSTAAAYGQPGQYGDLSTSLPAVDWANGAGARGGAAVPHPVYREVRELLERLAAPALVLILDDLHAADRRSVDLLASLLRQPPRAPVLFVLGYRDQQAGTVLRSAIAGSSPQMAAAHIHLGALSEHEVGQILAAQGIAGWRQQLYKDSWGNPAYLKVLISEQLSSPGRSGLPGLDQGAWPGHYAMFLAELARVTPVAREAIDAAAVVGNDFDAELVAQVLDQPQSVTLDAIGELMSLDLVHPMARGPYFAFRHPVVHRAVYYSSELGRRVQLHVRADALLRTRGVAPIERAPHVEQCARHGDLDATDVLDRAARAITGTEPVTAASWLTTALRLVPSQPRFEERRARMLVRLAKARGAAGDLRGCRDTMHEALRILPREPSAEHAKAVAFTAMVQRLLGTHAETGAMLLAEIDALGDGDPVGTAALKFEFAAQELGGGGWAACCRWAQEALMLAERCQNRSQQVACHGLLAKANVRGGDVEAAVQHLSQATAILDGMLDGDFAYSLDAVVWIGWADALLERWDDALRHFDRAVKLATRAGRVLALPHLLVGQVFAFYNTGRLVEAQAAAEYAVHLAQQSGSPEQIISAYSMLAWMDTIMGRMDRGVESATVACGQIRSTVGGFEALALRMLAEARLMAGDQEGCLALVSAVGGPSLVAADACSRVAWYELLTRAELALGRPQAALEWAESATASAAVADQPGRKALALLARAQALLAVDPEAALYSAEPAAAGLADAGMAVDALRARVVLGVALWHHDRYDDAVRELKDAQMALEQLGATTLVRLARTERRRIAARASKARRADSNGTATVFTDRERQVVGLVKDGLTNRLIARRLHISEKTVEMHLTKVFAKLGVSNRAAVAAFVARDQPENDAGRDGSDRVAGQVGCSDL